MYCTNCGGEIQEGSAFCPGCGHQVGAAPRAGGTSGAVAGAVGAATARLNEMAGGSGAVELRFGDFFSEAFKRHAEEEAEELFVCGTPRTTPPLAGVATTWPRPWLWTRVLFVMAVTFAGLVAIWHAFDNGIVLPGIILVGSFMVPLATMVFFFETNAPRNVSIVRVIKVFFVGGVLSLLATSMFSNVITGSGVGEFWPSMLTGLIEEAGKLVAVAFFMSHSRGRNYVLNGLLIGAAVGAGFAAFESAGYAFTCLFEGYESMMQNIALRGMLAIGGHVAWAAVEGAALALCEREGGFSFDQLANPAVLSFTGIMVALHGIWDMNVPYLDEIDLGYLGNAKYPLLIATVWVVVAVMLSRGLDQVNKLVRSDASQLGASAPAGDE